MRILNHPSLDRSVGRDSKYPLTQSVGRENLSGCHLAPRGLRPLGARWHPSRFSLPLSFVCGYSRISPFLTLSFGEDLWILTRSPPSITLMKNGSRNLEICTVARHQIEFTDALLTTWIDRKDGIPFIKDMDRI